MSRFRPLVVLVALVLSLTVLFGGWMLYRTYGIIKPAQEQLARLTAVSSATVTPDDPTHSVVVTLKPVDDLGVAYRDVLRTVRTIMGSNATILVKDHRSNELSNLYQTMQPMIYESMAKQDYVKLVNQMSAVSQANGVQGKMTMDQNNIYIQLKKGDNYLYDVLPYRNRASEVSAQ